MGIPHLAGHLQPYAIHTTLGHKNSNSITDIDKAPNYTLNLIIDGPALAYHIYYRLAHRSSNALSPFDAIPSYKEIGHAVLAFLSELEAHHIKITHIYFDGHLPHHKRPTRLSRLETSLKDLTKLRKKYPKGFPISSLPPSPVQSLPSSHLFNSFHSIPHALRGLPAPPFLVPAVLDVLHGNKYADITAIVPGEADGFCAKAARDEGGVILTGDSDLLVYDLGDKGAVVFFAGLEMQENEGGDGTVLRGMVYKTTEIANRFELPNLQRLAYEIKIDPNVGFMEAKRRARQSAAEEEDGVLWQGFREEYHYYSIPASPSLQEQQQQQQTHRLDPRLSELILQLSSSPSHEQADATIYLPFLIDDPSRSSAWDVSAEIRHALYDFLATHSTPPHPPSGLLQSIKE
ncbi:MAG: hypothetical protein Q9224_001045, partial [Gallowayella concinna]